MGGKAGGASARMERIFAMPFGSVYPLYVQKAEKKGRTKKEVDTIIQWMTGYSDSQLRSLLAEGRDFRDFFGKAPKLHPNLRLITGVVCGIRVEDVEEPLMQKVRYLDKLVDELAKGRAMDKILRS